MFDIRELAFGKPQVIREPAWLLGSEVLESISLANMTSQGYPQSADCQAHGHN